MTRTSWSNCAHCGTPRPAPGKGHIFCMACRPIRAAMRAASHAAESKAARDKVRWFLNWVKVSSGCVDCGYRSNVDALQFDHVRGVKERNVGTRCSTIRACLPELAKCEVRCANCHAIVTAQRRRA